ncbi:MAG: HPF/RaiA family ribosome-associated protein [Sphingomonadales bacterium]|nr:HPF/RaiA family ribosome-associated protein [Sphingomonadales bacterium]
MQTPLEIHFEGLDPSEAVSARVHEEAKRLERYHSRMTSCRVVIGVAHRHQHKGFLYSARLHITVPGGKEVVVSRAPDERHAHEDAYVAIRDAFKAAQRQLKSLQEKMRPKRGGAD